MIAVPDRRVDVQQAVKFTVQIFAVDGDIRRCYARRHRLSYFVIVIERLQPTVNTFSRVAEFTINHIKILSIVYSVLCNNIRKSLYGHQSGKCWREQICQDMDVDKVRDDITSAGRLTRVLGTSCMPQLITENSVQ